MNHRAANPLAHIHHSQRRDQLDRLASPAAAFPFHSLLLADVADHERPFFLHADHPAVHQTSAALPPARSDFAIRSFDARATALPLPSAPSHRRLSRFSENATSLRSIAASGRDIVRVPSRNNCRSLTAFSSRCSSFARSLSADSSPSASIRNCRSEYFRRNNFRLGIRFRQAVGQRLAPIPAASESCLRNSSFCDSNASRSLSLPRFQFWILTKNYFPALPAAADRRSPNRELRFDSQPLSAHRKSQLVNRKFTSLRHLRGVRTVFLKDTRRRKLAELVTDHVLGHEHRVKVLPLWTRKVWPTKSGVTIERRDQVFIGFFTPDAFILSIFSRRCGSTNGPFFNDLAIKSNYLFLLRRRSHDEAVARLCVCGAS